MAPTVKTAIIHDWLVTYGGADRVLEQILACFPDADLFSLVDFLPANEREFVLNKPVQTSFLQGLPFARRWFRKCLPLLTFAVEQFDLSDYDLVISSSHSVAKGVITGPDQLHICYCHAPMRYAWQLQHQYLQESGLDRGLGGLLARWMLHRARIWDLRTANGVDEFVVNSQFIARCIWKVYRRKARVIYPPVALDSLGMKQEKDDFYLTVSRLVPYKKVGLIVEAFNRLPDKRLIVIGDGPNFDKVRAIAGKNVTMMGFQDFNVVHHYLQRARAFVFAAEEDFGISVVEAQACGTPVIAFGKGGVLEIVRAFPEAEPTGIFFSEQTTEAITEAIHAFEREADEFNPEACRQNARRFSNDRFRTEFLQFCEDAIARHKAELSTAADDTLLSSAPANV
jgi:glycosyltransferase involved in cell wall biosynthesis